MSIRSAAALIDSTLASSAFQCAACLKFLMAFAPAFLGTAIPMGVIYVLVMRAIQADREGVEGFFERLRHRFESGPVPVIEWAQPLILGTLHAIYGRSLLRRLAVSFAFATLFSSIIFGVLYWRYTQISASMQFEKVKLERSVDPVLYDYATNPKLRAVYDAALSAKALPNVTFSPEGTPNPEPLTTGVRIYDELIDRHLDFQSKLLHALSANPAGAKLSLLFLVEGSYVHPGFEWMNSVCLFAFNVLLDFLSVTIAFTMLVWLGNDSSLLKATLAVLTCTLGTMACAVIAFSSYRSFFDGDLELFTRAFQTSVFLGVGFIGWSALSLGCGGKDVLGISKVLWGDFDDARFVYVFIGLCFLPIGFIAALAMWSTVLRPVLLGFVTSRYAFTFPYVLAATTLIPASIITVMFGLMLLTKFTVEPARVLSWGYMTFVKEELGGRQAAGIIIVLGVVAGAILALIWPPA